jgi:hypothetical protein
MRKISREQYNEYVGAVSRIVAALKTRNVLQPNQWNDMQRPQKQKIIDAVAEQDSLLELGDAKGKSNRNLRLTRTVSSLNDPELRRSLLG